MRPRTICSICVSLPFSESLSYLKFCILITLWFLFLHESFMNAYFPFKRVKLFYTCLLIFFFLMARFIFTSNPRGMVKLWKWSSASSHDALRESDVHLVAEFMSTFGARIMCLDASYEEEVIPYSFHDLVWGTTSYTFFPLCIVQ